MYNSHGNSLILQLQKTKTHLKSVLQRDRNQSSDVSLMGSIINKSGPSSRKKRKPVISLDSDESDDGVDKSSPEKATPKRNREISLTPPPILGAEAIRQAMTVIQEHQDHGHGRPNTRQMASLSSSQNPLKSDSLDSDDDTDITPYKSTINPEIAKQAARLAPQSKAPVAKPEVIKLVIYLVGRRNGDDSLPQDWETPVGFNILSSMSFSKLKAEFLNKKGYNKDVVLAFRDFQLFYGSPQEKNMKEGDKICNRLCRCTNTDVYSQKSWESFKDEKRRKLDRKEEDVVSLSSDDELAKPVPSVRLNLQCDAASAVHIRVQKVRIPFVLY